MSGNHAAQHPVFFPAGNRQNWIKSVATLGTPHKGTTITDVVQVSLTSASGEFKASMLCLTNSSVTYIATLTGRRH
jgi:triacylglycerol esterase/lipase EstA (alpha/beta hydrolase family)